MHHCSSYIVGLLYMHYCCYHFCHYHYCYLALRGSRSRRAGRDEEEDKEEEQEQEHNLGNETNGTGGEAAGWLAGRKLSVSVSRVGEGGRRTHQTERLQGLSVRGEGVKPKPKGI